MTDQEEKVERRKRINRMKKVLVITAICLVLISLTLNLVLLFQVIHLNLLVREIYGIHIPVSLFLR